MIQKMLNHININIADVNLELVTDIVVTFKQKSSDVELTYSNDSIQIVDSHNLKVTIPKDDAMKLINAPVRGQVMFTYGDTPLATSVFTTSVTELLKGDGYGN